MKSINSAADISLTFAESSTLSTKSNSAIRLGNYGTGFTNIAINGVASSAASDTAVFMLIMQMPARLHLAPEKIV
jgi:hypothetical protein